MQTYILRRILQAIPLLLGVSVLTFVIIQLMPGGVMGAYGPNTGSGADLARIQEQLGLNRPLYVQYLSWLERFIVGDWGKTLISQQNVKELITTALPPTLLLIGASIVVGLGLGLVFGVVSAVKQYTFVDMLLTSVSFVGLSMPVFFFGLILILVFSVKLNWLPGGGMYTPTAPFSIADRLRYLILPVLAIAFPLAGEYTRYVRSAVLEVLNQDYIRTAYSKGLMTRVVLIKHALRNALVPLITIIALQIPWMIGGFVVSESIFSWPGMGRLLWKSATEHDYPLMMSITMLVAVAVLAANLAADLLYGLADPRISYD